MDRCDVAYHEGPCLDDPEYDGIYCCALAEADEQA